MEIARRTGDGDDGDRDYVRGVWAQGLLEEALTKIMCLPIENEEKVSFAVIVAEDLLIVCICCQC